MRRLTVLALLAVLPGCKDKKKAPAPGGQATPQVVLSQDLKRVPKDAAQIASVDVAAVAKSPLVARAVKQMLSRDAELKERIDHLQTDCDLKPENVSRITVAVNGDRSVLIAQGQLEPGRIAGCVAKRLPASGAKLVSIKVADQAAFQLVNADGKEQLVFAFPKDGTVVVSSSKDWLAASLGDDAGLSANPTMKSLLGRINPAASLWAAGSIPEEIGKNLVQAAGQPTEQLPQTMFLELDLRSGVKAHLAVDMPTPDGARSLVSLGHSQLMALKVLASERKMGELLSGLEITSEGPAVHVHAGLTQQQAADLAARVDSLAPSGQDAPLPDQGADGDGKRVPTPGSETPVRK